MTRLTLVKGDITRLEVDAIVNAANSWLMGGGGVDGAIHHAGGPAIMEECRVIIDREGRVATGEAVVTSGGRLPAKQVIHTVGPIWGEMIEEEAVRLLASCYRSSLDRAAEIGARTVAFPNVSTGVYGFPKELAADTAVAAVESWLEDHHDSVDEVIFVCFDDENHQLYARRLSISGEDADD